MLKTIVITSGEPAGIGPDLMVELAHTAIPARIVVLGDIDVLQSRAATLGKTLEINETAMDKLSEHYGEGQLNVCHIATPQPVEIGKLNIANAPYVLQLLDEAIQGCLDNQWQAIVTAPIHKSVIIEAGISFTGHTEYLANKFDTPVVMMLANSKLRVALVTTHLPLREVPKNITVERLQCVIKIVCDDLIKRFDIINPRIGVCGLNPHAGEAGHLGNEEQEIMMPAIENMRKENIDVSNPMPADTIFAPHQQEYFDVIIAMYHDQGLPVIKHSGFGETVNITLGLPYVRTSVDHGTALSLAGTGNAMPNSLISAIHCATKLT